MDYITVQRELENVYNKIDTVYRNEALAKTEFIRLDRKKKSFFAAIKAKFTGPDNAREREAFCDKVWTGFELTLINAERKHITTLSVKDSLDAKKEILRSLNKNPDINF